MSKFILSKKASHAFDMIASSDLEDPVALVKEMGYDHETFFQHATFIDLDFRNSDLTGVSFKGARLQRIKIHDYQEMQIRETEPLQIDIEEITATRVLSENAKSTSVLFPIDSTDDRDIGITHGDLVAFLREIRTKLASRTSFSVAFFNLDTAVKLRRDKKLQDAYLAHSHVVADGQPIQWLARLSGSKIDLMPGHELLLSLCEIASELHVPVGFVGWTELSLKEAAVRLEHRYPDLRVVTKISPSMGFDPDGSASDDIAQQMIRDDVGLCFLALGPPKQERLAAELQSAMPNCGFISVGAGLEFVTGQQTRAPMWVRRAALEWLWRLSSNPRRLSVRYASSFAILPRLTLRAVFGRKRIARNSADNN